MATRMNYDATHAVAYPSKLIAQNGGKHIYHIELATETDNGNLVAKGDFIDLDLYEEAAATTFEGIIQKKAANGNWYVEVVEAGDALFVYMPPFIEEEWTKTLKNEKRWFNAAGSTVRGYELAVGDVFELSAEGFDGTPEAGKSVSVANKKLVVA
jgi:hypothetical protein